MTGVRRYAKTLTADEEEFGFLCPNLMAARCVWLGDYNIARLAAHGCSVALNLGSNIRRGPGVSAARKVLGINNYSGVGTDGLNYSVHQNIFRAMYLGRNIHTAKLLARVAAWVERLRDQSRKLQTLADGISSFRAGSLQEPYEISQLCGCADAARIAAFQVEPI